MTHWVSDHLQCHWSYSRMCSIWGWFSFKCRDFFQRFCWAGTNVPPISTVSSGSVHVQTQEAVNTATSCWKHQPMFDNNADVFTNSVKVLREKKNSSCFKHSTFHVVQVLSTFRDDGQVTRWPLTSSGKIWNNFLFSNTNIGFWRTVCSQTQAQTECWSAVTNPPPQCGLTLTLSLCLQLSSNFRYYHVQ